MKDRNPFKLNLILWSCILLYSFTMCIVSIYTSSNIAIIIHLCFVVFDSFFLGWTICKYFEYNDFIESKNKISDLLEMCVKEMEKNKNEPFKEFDNGKEEN